LLMSFGERAPRGNANRPRVEQLFEAKEKRNEEQQNS